MDGVSDEAVDCAYGLWHRTRGRGSMEHTAAMADLLGRHGFRGFAMSRSPVGHLTLAGQLDDRPVDIVLDTGASKTIVELNYCRTEGLRLMDTGKTGPGGNVC